MEFTITTNIELADIQNTVETLEDKLNWLEDNYSYAVNEIRKIKIALEVLNDLETDVANMD